MARLAVLSAVVVVMAMQAIPVFEMASFEASQTGLREMACSSMLWPANKQETSSRVPDAGLG
jgi:hypothetical protein